MTSLNKKTLSFRARWYVNLGFKRLQPQGQTSVDLLVLVDREDGPWSTFPF